MNQREIDKANAAFWGDEICGTHLARTLGAPSIAEFDAAYLKVYPWLRGMIEGLANRGDRVLEIGPGYGTVGRLLVARGAEYHALDIAPAVIEHTREHTSFNAVVGSVLKLDKLFDAESFDAACAIGSLHHTGDLPLAIKQVHRVLRPGGKALVMLYGEGDTKDFHADGTPAPYTVVTPPEQAPALFAAFSAVQVEHVSPHGHLDLYVRAIK